MAKKLTVKELKELEPRADIYELSKFSKYIVTIRRSELDIDGRIAHQKAQVVMQILTQAEIPCVILIGMNDDVKFMEIQ